MYCLEKNKFYLELIVKKKESQFENHSSRRLLCRPEILNQGAVAP